MQTMTSRNVGFTLVEIMIVVAIVGLLATIAIPNFLRARETAQLNSIVNNLRLTEGVKDQWALENKKGSGDVPVYTDLSPYMKNGLFPPSTIVGETYNILAVGSSSTATTPIRLGTYAINSNVTLP